MDIKLIDRQLKQNRNETIRRKWWFLKSAYSSGNISDYCRSRGIKRSYYHFWFKRLRDFGGDVSSLPERSRRPKHSPNQTSAKLVKKIKWERKREDRGASAIHFMNGLLEKAPFAIECIQTEHGLDKLCRENGIRHKLMPVGQCEVNGKVAKEVQRERLHGGIGWKTPAEFLQAETNAISDTNCLTSPWVYMIL